MRPRHRVLALLAVVAALIGGCTSDQGSSAPESGASSAPARTFSVDLPQGYREDRSRISGAIAAFYLGPLVKGFRVNVNITRQSSKGASLPQFQVQSVTGLRRTLKIRELSEPTATTVDGERALRYTFEDSQQGFELKQSQTVVLHHGYGYVLTFTAPADEYTAEQADATTLIRSLRWT